MLTAFLLLACAADDPSSPKDTSAATTAETDADADGYAAPVDCDDANADVHPDTAEVAYDGVDNDCDPASPDDDLDGDGFPAATDCDDDDPATSPAAQEVGGDERDNDCDPATTDEDADGDGVLFGVDCDDADASAGEPVRVRTMETDTCATHSCVIAPQIRWNRYDDLLPEHYACVVEVEGDVSVYETTLTSLEHLQRLRRIGGYFGITGNASLTSLAALRSLHSIGESLGITGNTSLASLEGLDSLVTVGSVLRVSDNDLLTSLEGLESLRSTGAGVEIEDNDELRSLDGLEGLTSLTEGGASHDNLLIRGNPRLTSLAALRNLTSDVDDVILEDNATLASLDGLQGFSVIDTLRITNQPAITDLGAVAGRAVYQLSLTNVGVVNLDALVDTDIRRFYFTDLPALASLPSAPTLTLIEITNAPSLTSLSGLGYAQELQVLRLDNVAIHDLAGVQLRTGMRSDLELTALPYLRDLSGMAPAYEVDLVLTDMPALESLDGLAARIDDTLALTRNPVLSDLSALSTSTDAETVRIVDNDALTTLAGLEGMRRIRYLLEVTDNAALADVTALHALQSVDDVTIRANPSLAREAIDAMLAEIDTIDGTVTVE